MKTFELPSIPDGKRAEWINGVLTLVDDTPLEPKFKVGDKVKCAVNPLETYTIKSIGFQDGKYIYTLESEIEKTRVAENLIELISEDVTGSKVKYKFNVGDKVIIEDYENLIFEVVKHKDVEGLPAYELKHNNFICSYFESYIKPYVPQDITERIKTFGDACEVLGERNRLVQDYQELDAVDLDSPDILAYLKLRIITAVFNEGWEPKFDEEETRYYPYSFIDTDNLGVDYEVTAISFPAMLCFKSERHAKYAAKQFRDIYADFCGCKKENNK